MQFISSWDQSIKCYLLNEIRIDNVTTLIENNNHAATCNTENKNMHFSVSVMSVPRASLNNVTPSISRILQCHYEKPYQSQIVITLVNKNVAS